MDSHKSTRPMLLMTAILWLLSCGCSSIHVPAIDPTGARIFAPSGSYTTLQSPCGSLLPASALPRPAFAEPPAVSACPTPVAAAPQIGTVPIQPRPTRTIVAPGAPDRLMLTPSKIVAPVGSEVVLLAGLYGSDGHFVTRQPVEWMLSQESVGNFVDVGESDHSTLAALLHKPHDRRSSNFAVARTSSRAQAITRGTPATNDDIWLQRGQTWVTMTAASEGISHVTAVATNADNWEQRRQTATIQWVDAQWMPPAPTVVRAGESVVLETVINRNSSRSPVRGWIVRYEVVSGPQAVLGEQRASSIEVRTGADGKAPVALFPIGHEPGVTQVKFEILSPSLTGLDGEPVVVGQGVTSVTWSAAGLAVRISGPPMAAVGAKLNYQIEVTNPGDLPAENVQVTVKVPQTLRLPQQEGVQGRFATWNIDRLPPKGSQVINLECEAMTDGNVFLFADATANGVTSERARFNTEVTASALQVDMEMVDDPTRTEITVGSRVSFNILVTNTSNAPLANVKLLDNHAAGLQEANGEPNPISKSIGNLAPGASQQLALTFIVRQPGELWHRLEATADGGHIDTVERSFRASAPRYDVAIELVGQERVALDDTVKYDMVVKNTGEGELTGIRVVFSVTDALNLKSATQGYDIEAGSLVWNLGALAPGQTSRKLTVVCDTVEPSNAAIATALVDTQQQQTTRTQQSTVIFNDGPVGVAPSGPATPAPNANNGPPRGPTANASPLEVSIADINDPVAVGETAAYTVVINNLSELPQRDVGVTFQLPEGTKFVNLLGRNNLPVPTFVSPDGRQVSLEPAIREIRPLEEMPPYRLEFEVTQPGQIVVMVNAKSINSDDPTASAEATTTVSGN